MSEAQDAQAPARHLCIRGLDGSTAIGCQDAVSAVRLTFVTTLCENVLRTAFHGDQEACPFSVLSHHESLGFGTLLQTEPRSLLPQPGNVNAIAECQGDERSLSRRAFDDALPVYEPAFGIATQRGDLKHQSRAGVI